VPSPSRRDFLQRAFASAAGGVWLRASWADLLAASDHASAVATGQQPAQLTVLTSAEGTLVEALSERIFPADDTPGARALGAVYFIDRALGTFAREQLTMFRTGLAEIGVAVRAKHPAATSFVSLTEQQQDEMLRAIETTPFFGALREATIAGCLSRPEYGGNRDSAGWKMIGFEDRMKWDPPFGYYDRDEVRATLLPPRAP
jgi:hypothetical protein